eukprot:gene11370-8088_t
MTSSLPDLLARLTAREILDEDNRWKCSNCQARVCAEKQLAYPSSSFPDNLCIQLKRFSFDRATFRRLKVSSSVTFPLQLAMQYQSPSGGMIETPYELTGVVCHFGTALGGHYRAIVRCHDTSQSTSRSDSTSQWYECDDEIISPITEAELEEALSNAHPSVSTTMASSTSDERKKHRLALLQENAYLLFYSRRTPEPLTLPRQLPMLPPSVMTAIQDENEVYLQLQRLGLIRQQLVELAVVFPRPRDLDDDKDPLPHQCRLYFPKDLTVEQLREIIIRYWYTHVQAKEQTTIPSPSMDALVAQWSLARLRRILHPS